MRNHILSLFLGFTATGTLLTSMTVEAATFDYNRVKNISTRPIESNQILHFFGDQSQNEGYVVFSNLDPDAPDSGHIGLSPNSVFTSYYTAGREFSPDATGATRSASLEKIIGLSNFYNYLSSNNISLTSIGFSYGPKSGRDLTKTWNLGEDKLGQDWFSSPDSNIDENIYQANPDNVEAYLSYGNTKIINFGYSPFYALSVNDNSANFGDNLNIILNDPIPVSKVAGLDSLTSGLADAFLKDVAAGGGNVQFVSEDSPQESDISASFNNGYQTFALSFPFELRVVSGRSVPEPSAGLGFLMFGVLFAVSQIKKQK
ncbi:PEP-CTERM sorting domain-containing protein [Nostoc sphaeroides CHAB 2801]|uniref:PEP-CTERM sorting domain-containing protein n=1 Tax=Nostoc sphaeroides TaxID=446679 RepID=UPI001E4B2578|nr:PEP-CTERM sorting domain-containing protein [Nostoc sphaeroides]MCC5632200.1 PEP-CTERM sorting domain-containing protein [Nostoc sphaeroides CHAB 2801]